MFRKSITAIFVIIVICFFLLYVFSSSILHQVTADNLEKVEFIATGHNFQNVDIEFSEVFLSGPRTATWRGIDIRGEKLHTNNVIPLRLVIDRVDGRVAALHPLEIVLEVGDFKVGGESLGQQKAFQFLLSGDQFKIKQEVDLSEPGRSLHHLASALDALASGEHIPEPFEISAAILLQKEDVIQSVRLVAKRYIDGYGLAFSPEDLKRFTSKLSGTYTTGELDLISSYPFRALKLIDIKRDAETSAALEYETNKDLPEDAYRHILWSFLLTRAFGHEFAERVTNAHEEGLAAQDVFAREMDLINNKIGRDYALSPLKRDEILPRMLKDSRVVQGVESLQ